MRRLELKAIVILCAVMVLGSCESGDPADLILVGGPVYTMDADNNTFDAVAIRGERIVFVGNREEIGRFKGSTTRIIDTKTMTVLPGFIDSHGHLMNLGRSLTNIDVVGTRSPGEVRSKVIEWQKDVPAGEWIWGRGWDQNDWEVKEFPTWKDLEGTEENPVYLRRVDGHASLVNRTALDMFGIDRNTPDPPGGEFIRDANGDPTGVMIDMADENFRRQIPTPSLEVQAERIGLAIRACNRVGLTGVHDAGTRQDYLKAYRRLHMDGKLTLRVYAMLDSDESIFVSTELRKGPRTEANGRISVRSVKVYVDGALGSRGAMLIDPYDDRAGHVGFLRTPREELERWTQMALENGCQVGTHAIGDAGNRLILDIYEEAIKRFPGIDHRLRIEHAQMLALEDIPRLGANGIIAAMQPTHCTSDMYWVEDRIGSDRVKGAYAWRRLIDSGCVIACGSDFPVESHNPLWGIYAAVTRQDHDGFPFGGWYPEQRMTVEEAVRGFTTNAAYAEFAENEKGSIEVGKLADIVVLDKNIFEIDAEKILDTKVMMTILDGDMVYSVGNQITER